MEKRSLIPLWPCVKRKIGSDEKHFWDSSALVSLLVEEDMSEIARSIWAGPEQAWVWDWALIEVDSALTRRDAGEKAWSKWNEIQAVLFLSRLEEKHLESLRLLNRSIGLRAAEAGHLFMFEKLTVKIPNLQLVSFDRELSNAARRLGLMLHAECLH